MKVENLIDGVKNLSNVFSQRVFSPLFSSFFISLILFNWQVLVFLFWGKGSAAYTINSIQAHYLQLGLFTSTFYLFVGPLIATAFYVFIYPHPARWVYEYSKIQSEILVKLKNDIEGNRLLSLEESQTLRMRMQQLQSDFSQMLQSKDEEIVLLKRQVEEISKREAANLNTIVTQTSRSEIEEWNKEFKDFEYHSLFSSFQEYLEKFTVGVRMVDIHISDRKNVTSLSHLGLIDIKDSYCTLTDKGKFFAKRLVQAF